MSLARVTITFGLAAAGPTAALLDTGVNDNNTAAHNLTRFLYEFLMAML